MFTVVIEVGDAVKGAGVAERVIDGALADQVAANAVKEAAGAFPVRGVEKVEGGLGAVEKEALDGVVVAGAAETGEVADGVGARFADRLSPLLETGVVAGAAKDGGDGAACTDGGAVAALAVDVRADGLELGEGSDGFRRHKVRPR